MKQIERLVPYICRGSASFACAGRRSLHSGYWHLAQVISYIFLSKKQHFKIKPVKTNLRYIKRHGVIYPAVLPAPFAPLQASCSLRKPLVLMSENVTRRHFRTAG